MKQIKLLSLAVMAVFALTGLMAASASAEQLPNVLPTAGTGAAKEVKANTSSKTAEFGNGLLKITSPKSSGTQTGNATKLGFYKTTFVEAKDTLGRKCTTGTETAGTIISEGTFHTRDYKKGAELATASVLLVKEQTFKCGELEIKVKGCVAGQLTPENTLTKTLTLHLEHEGSKNDEKIITVLNEANTANELCELLSSSDGKAFELSSQQQEVAITEFKQNGAAVEELVMKL
jgi:hypothetical protein